MKMIQINIAVLLLTMSILSSPNKSFSQSTPHATINSVVSKWATYLHNKNIKGTMTLYTDDAVFYSPGSKPSNGKKEIFALYTMVTNKYNSDISFVDRNLQVSGDLAYKSVDYVETLYDRSTKKAVKFKGNCLFVLKQVNNQWLITQQMWTTAN